MDSTEAAAIIVDETFDVVYIDARHDYRSVAEDINAWWPKVKPGGILAGHDYLFGQINGTLISVKPAVDEFVYREGVLLFVTQDRFPTWFVYKSERMNYDRKWNSTTYTHD